MLNPVCARTVLSTLLFLTSDAVRSMTQSCYFLVRISVCAVCDPLSDRCHIDVSDLDSRAVGIVYEMPLSCQL